MPSSIHCTSYGIDDLLALLALGDRPPTTLFLRFEPLVRLPERARAVARASAPTSLGVFVSWKVDSIRRGDVDRLIVLDALQGCALMRACRTAGLRFVDNTELRAAG